MQQQNQIKAAIFDMDGVIITTSTLHETAWRTAGIEHGMTWQKGVDFRRDVFGTISADSAKMIFDSDLSPIVLEELIKTKDHAYEKLLTKQIAEIVVPGFIEFINLISNKGIRIAVATSSRKEEAHFVLKSLDIVGKLDAVIDSSWIKKPKPDPEAYLTALRTLNLSADECIAFEDSLSGVRSVLSAGISCILVKTTMNEAKLMQHNLRCEFAINNFLDDQIEIFQHLFERKTSTMIS